MEMFNVVWKKRIAGVFKITVSEKHRKAVLLHASLKSFSLFCLETKKVLWKNKVGKYSIIDDIHFTDTALTVGFGGGREGRLKVDLATGETEDISTKLGSRYLCRHETDQLIIYNSLKGNDYYSINKQDFSINYLREDEIEGNLPRMGSTNNKRCFASLKEGEDYTGIIAHVDPVTGFPTLEYDLYPDSLLADGDGNPCGVFLAEDFYLARFSPTRGIYRRYSFGGELLTEYILPEREHAEEIYCRIYLPHPDTKTIIFHIQDPKSPRIYTYDLESGALLRQKELNGDRGSICQIGQYIIYSKGHLGDTVAYDTSTGAFAPLLDQQVNTCFAEYEGGILCLLIGDKKYELAFIQPNTEATAASETTPEETEKVRKKPEHRLSSERPYSELTLTTEQAHESEHGGWEQLAVHLESLDHITRNGASPIYHYLYDIEEQLDEQTMEDFGYSEERKQIQRSISTPDYHDPADLLAATSRMLAWLDEYESGLPHDEEEELIENLQELKQALHSTTTAGHKVQLKRGCI